MLYLSYKKENQTVSLYSQQQSLQFAFHQAELAYKHQGTFYKDLGAEGVYLILMASPRITSEQYVRNNHPSEQYLEQKEREKEKKSGGSIMSRSN